MPILDEARGILERAGYLVFSADATTLEFEDDTLMGFIAAYQFGEEIVRSWRDRQSSFLRKNAPALRSSGLKSWNVYSVFLAASNNYTETKRELLAIEEDFQSTRKIAQSNLVSATDVSRALFPLLSIQNLVELRQEDPTERLRARVGEKIFNAVQTMESTEELAQIFLETK